MNDDFYDLPKPTVKKIKEIFLWSKKNSYDTHVECLDCNTSFARQPTEMSFQKALKLINKNASGFFRLIYRRMVFGYEKKEGYIEVAVRNLNLEGKEYFIYSFLDFSKLEEIIKKFKLEKIT